MKAAYSFLRDTLTGGILFLMPLVLLIIILKKATQILTEVSVPLAERMPEFIGGLDGSKIVTVVLLVAICFLGGLTFRLSRVRQSMSNLEEKLLSHLPGYTMVKAIVTDTLGSKEDHNMTTVLIHEGDSWSIGFLVEIDGDLCTVFIPEAPRHDSGEVRIVPADSVTMVDVSTNRAVRSLRQYGKGASAWIKVSGPELSKHKA